MFIVFAYFRVTDKILLCLVVGLLVLYNSSEVSGSCYSAT